MHISGIFNYESPIWKYLGYIWDALTLTLIWALFSLPIVTIGASTSALYTVTLRMMRDEEGPLWSDFVRAFKDNLKQGVLAGIIMAALGLIFAYNIYTLYNLDSDSAKSMLIAMLILVYVFLMVFKYIFPVIARFSNSISNLFVIAFILSVKNFGWTLLMVVLTVSIALVSVFVFWPLIFFSVGIMALVDSWILNHVFENYIAENKLC